MDRVGNTWVRARLRKADDLDDVCDSVGQDETVEKLESCTVNTKVSKESREYTIILPVTFFLLSSLHSRVPRDEEDILKGKVRVIGQPRFLQLSGPAATAAKYHPATYVPGCAAIPLPQWNQPRFDLRS